MDKSENLNFGIKVLNAILQKWKKQNKDNQNECDIFLPKIDCENDIDYFLFPIFEKVDSNKFILIEWVKLNLKEVKVEFGGKINETYEIDESSFNFYDNENQAILEAFIRPYRISQLVLKGTAKNEDLENALKKYDDTLEAKVSDDLYYLYYDENEEIENEENFTPVLDDEEDFEPVLDDFEEEDTNDEKEDKIDDEDEFTPVLDDEEEFESVLDDEEDFEPVLDDFEEDTNDEKEDKIDDEDEFTPVLDDEEEFEPILNDEEEVTPVLDYTDETPVVVEENDEDILLIDSIEDENSNKIEDEEDEIEATENVLKQEDKAIKVPGFSNEEYSVKEIMKKFNNIENLENTEYDFDWELENGLRFISDNMFDIIEKMLKKGEFKLSKKDGKFVISNKIKSLCTKDITNEKFEEELDTSKCFTENEGTYTFTNENAYEDWICVGCKFEKCPKYYAGYILYLKNTQMLEEKLQDREDFRKKKFKSDYFSFKWENETGVKNVTQEIFDIAQNMVDKECIFVQTTLQNDNVKIWSSIKCSNLALTNGDIDKILDLSEKNYNSWVSITRKNNKILDFCSTYNCRLNGCPLNVAGYIYYLKKTGQENKILEDRKYYEKHKEEIDNAILIKKNEKLQELEEKKKQEVEGLKNYESKIKNIDSLIDTILIKNQKNLHITLEGSDKNTKKECEEIIINVLNSLDKIKDRSYQRISLQNFAARNAYFYSTANNVSKEKKNGNDENGTYYEISDEVVYTLIEKRKLFIIDGIKEFVNDYKLYKMMGNCAYKELREKQFSHMIDMLTNLSAENYIILDATEKEIDSLLDLDLKLKFVFESNRYKVENTSIDEMFTIYLNGIKPELLETFRKNEKKIQKDFIEYISLNKEFIPFSEIELANYLSTYANSKNDMVFPPNVYKKEDVAESLKNIIGMENVKNKVKEFEKYVLFTVKAKTLGLELQKSNLHMVFTGNPGTGKTTIARIMAKMLYDLGLIKENKLVEVERKDLVAGYIGQTATKTEQVLEKAMGGVLFVDEAYTLSSGSANDFGAEAVATIIKTMEDKKDNIVVIFAGYKDEMQSFLDINPGIASRIGYTFDFPDYTPQELTQIFERKVSKIGFEINEEIASKVQNICEYFVKKKNFGNGRFIDKLIQETIMKHAISDEEIKKISIKDIPTIEELNNTQIAKTVADDLLQNLVGMTELKTKIKEFETYIKFVKEAENNNINIPNQNLHMIFTGNPGTGKTTIARIIAEILFDLGIIHENKLVEVERKDLVAGYIGQTAPKTTEVIQKAMGGVLFIDEAYTLSSTSTNDFGAEAIATLIKAMEDHKGEFVVIFAGYKKEMSDFININPGIASRIGYTFDFPDYTADEYCKIFYNKIDKIGMKIKDDAKEDILKLMKYFANVENIGNGRFVDRVIQETLLKHSKIANKKIDQITKESIPTIQEMTKNLFNGKNMINPQMITEESQKRTAVHEIGHAALRYLLFENSGIKRITINAEGSGSLGYVSYRESVAKYTSSKTYKKNMICVALAGMASEQVFLNEFESGNSSDLEKATNIAKAMIIYYGMSDLGLGQIENPNGALSGIIQTEINKILKECFDKTIEIINQNKEKIQKAVDYLFENKEIDEEEFVNIFEGKSISKKLSKEANENEKETKTQDKKTKSEKNTKSKKEEVQNKKTAKKSTKK